jgi:hypothetical protein
MAQGLSEFFHLENENIFAFNFRSAKAGLELRKNKIIELPNILGKCCAAFFRFVRSNLIKF